MINETLLAELDLAQYHKLLYYKTVSKNGNIVVIFDDTKIKDHHAKKVQQYIQNTYKHTVTVMQLFHGLIIYNKA